MLTNALRSHRPLSLFAVVAALTAVACQPTVIGGGGTGAGGNDGQGGNGLGGTATGGVGGFTGGSGGAGPTTAIAEYAYMMPDLPPGGGSSSSSGGPGVDPNTLYLKIGNHGLACGGQFTSGCGPDTLWEASIALPPDMQAAGGVYPLSDQALIASFFESGGSGQECWGGGGSITDGTLEIVSNDGLTIVVTISGVNAQIIEAPLDGTYSAPICQWAVD